MSRVSISFCFLLLSLVLSIVVSNPYLDLLALGLGGVAFIALIYSLARSCIESPGSLDWS